MFARRGDSRIARRETTSGLYILFVGADIIRPSLDFFQAGGVAEQAAAGSAEGGAVKQSEAILDGVFLSSPILSFARKRKNGKKIRSFSNKDFSPVRSLVRNDRDGPHLCHPESSPQTGEGSWHSRK